VRQLIRLPGFCPATGANSSQPGIRSDIAPPGGFCKREPTGAYSRTQLEERAQQGALRNNRRQAEPNTTIRLPGFSPATGANSSQPGIRSDIAPPGGFCKREPTGAYSRTQLEERAQQGALRQSEIAPC